MRSRALACSRLFRLVVGCWHVVRVAFRSLGEVVSKAMFFRCSVFFVCPPLSTLYTTLRRKIVEIEAVTVADVKIKVQQPRTLLELTPASESAKYKPREHCEMQQVMRRYTAPPSPQAEKQQKASLHDVKTRLISIPDLLRNQNSISIHNSIRHRKTSGVELYRYQLMCDNVFFQRPKGLRFLRESEQRNTICLFQKCPGYVKSLFFR